MLSKGFHWYPLLFSLVSLHNANIYRSRLRLRSAPVWGCPLNRGSTSGTNPTYGATPSASQLIVRVHFNQRLRGGNERGWPCVGGADAPPTHGHRRSFPPLSRRLKWTLTMGCETLGLAPYVDFVPEVLPQYKGQPQTGAERRRSRERYISPL